MTELPVEEQTDAMLEAHTAPAGIDLHEVFGDVVSAFAESWPDAEEAAPGPITAGKAAEWIHWQQRRQEAALLVMEFLVTAPLHSSLAGLRGSAGMVIDELHERAALAAESILIARAKWEEDGGS